MNKPHKLTLPLLALSSGLLLSSVALSADDKKPRQPRRHARRRQGRARRARRACKRSPSPIQSQWSAAKTISKAAFEQYAQQLRSKAKVDSPDASKSLVDQLVMEELLVQQANKQKLEDDPQIKQQLEMIQRSLLASTVVRRMLSENAPSRRCHQERV